MSLQGDAAAAAITTHLANEGVDVLGFEELADEGAFISEHGDAPAVIDRERSALRAVWIVDVPSRDVAVELAKRAPGGEGTIEIRESFTPEDFGAPPDPNPPVRPPPPVRKPDTHRYLALIGGHHEERLPPPTPESTARMDAYCATLVEDNTMLGGEGLKPSAKGTRVRRAAAQRFVLDGPFTESKELVGGYMIVQTRTLDDAVETIRPWLRIHREALGVDRAVIEVRRLVG